MPWYYYENSFDLRKFLGPPQFQDHTWRVSVMEQWQIAHWLYNLPLELVQANKERLSQSTVKKLWHRLVKYWNWFESILMCFLCQIIFLKFDLASTYYNYHLKSKRMCTLQRKYRNMNQCNSYINWQLGSFPVPPTTCLIPHWKPMQYVTFQEYVSTV